MIVSNISKIMKAKKNTIRGLMPLTGLSNVTICRARGALISESRMSTLEAIAKALDVKVKDLFDEMPDPPAGSEDVANR